jgi:hypothetical protein
MTGIPVMEKNDLKIDEYTSSRKESILIIAFTISAFIAITVPALGAIFKYAVIPIIMLALYKTDSFEFLLFPLCFLDNQIGTYVAGRLTLLWIYLAAMILRWLFSKRKLIIRKDRLLPLVILFSYFIFASFDFGFNSLKMILVLFFFYQVSEQIQDNPQKLVKLYYVIIFSSLICALGLAFNLLGQGDAIRSEGIGFSDPNYASFICLIGFCASINYKCKSKIAQIIFILFDLIFVFAIFRSGSRAGLIILVIVILLHIIMGKGITKRLKRLSLISVISLTAIYIVFTMIDLPFVAGLIERWQYTFDTFQAGNMSRTTANRSDVFATYFSYYQNQNIFKILFGGNIIASSSLLSQSGGMVTHNVYLDYLMAFGAIGSIIMLYYNLKRIWQYYKKYVISGEPAYAAAVEIKLMAMVFGFTLAFATVNMWWVIFLL